MPTWDPVANRLSNPHFELVIEPRHGGRIVSLLAQGQQLTRGAAPEQFARPRVEHQFGLLSVQLWQDSYWHNDLCHRDWPIVDQQVTSNRVAITLEGDSALWPGVTVRRSYILTDDPWVQVDHRLDPGLSTKTYLPPAFWFSNVLRGRGRSFVPGPSGVLEHPRWAQDQSWCHEPVDGWMAWMNGRIGLVFTTDHAQLRQVRLRHLQHDQVEWIRRRVDTVEQTTVRVVPFVGPPRVDGVGPAAVMGLVEAAGAIRVSVFPLYTGQATLTLDLVDTGGAVTNVATATASVTAGQVAVVRVGGAAGTGWWRGTVTIAHPQGTATATFMAHAGDPSNPYLRGLLPSTAQTPELPRPERTHRYPPRSFTFDASPVPMPAPWLRRRASRPRVLALVGRASTASMLAVAREFDLDLTLPFVPRTPPASLPPEPDRYDHELGDRFEGVWLSELVTAWTDVLDGSRSYDVIVLGDLEGDPFKVWSVLPPGLKRAIVDRARAGTGLVVIRRGDWRPLADRETTALRGLLPLRLERTSDYDGPLSAGGDRTVDGLPWSMIPGFSGGIHAFSLDTVNKPGAEVLVSVKYAAEDYPLLARWVSGAVRVLDLVWGPDVVPLNQRRAPPQGTLGMDTLRYDLAFLARVICDAAGREPAIAVRKMVVGGTTATVTLEQVSAAAGAFELDWVARDRFSVVLARGRVAARRSRPAISPLPFPKARGPSTSSFIPLPESQAGAPEPRSSISASSPPRTRPRWIVTTPSASRPRRRPSPTPLSMRPSMDAVAWSTVNAPRPASRQGCP